MADVAWESEPMLRSFSLTTIECMKGDLNWVGNGMFAPHAKISSDLKCFRWGAVNTPIAGAALAGISTPLLNQYRR